MVAHQKRRGDGVDRVLGHGLDDGPHDAGAVEPRDVTTDEPGKADPGAIEVAGGDRAEHGIGFIGEHPPGDGDGRGDERGGGRPGTRRSATPAAMPMPAPTAR